MSEVEQIEARKKAYLEGKQERELQKHTKKLAEVRANKPYLKAQAVLAEMFTALDKELPAILDNDAVGDAVQEYCVFKLKNLDTLKQAERKSCLFQLLSEVEAIKDAGWIELNVTQRVVGSILEQMLKLNQR